jgi:antitoxin component of RelBE/YafQ-DinJ toxin-antitoxin module
MSHLISLRLPDDLLKRLGEVGQEQGLSMSDTIRLVLERGLAARRKSARKDQP